MDSAEEVESDLFDEPSPGDGKTASTTWIVVGTAALTRAKLECAFDGIIRRYRVCVDDHGERLDARVRVSGRCGASGTARHHGQ